MESTSSTQAHSLSQNGNQLDSDTTAATNSERGESSNSQQRSETGDLPARTEAQSTGYFPASSALGSLFSVSSSRTTSKSDSADHEGRFSIMNSSGTTSSSHAKPQNSFTSSAGPSRPASRRSRDGSSHSDRSRKSDWKVLYEPELPESKTRPKGTRVIRSDGKPLREGDPVIELRDPRLELLDYAQAGRGRKRLMIHLRRVKYQNDDASFRSPIVRSIFVSGLPFSITTAELQTLFKPFGDIASVINEVHPHTAQNVGFASIIYAGDAQQAAAAARRAVDKMDGHIVADKPLRVQLDPDGSIKRAAIDDLLRPPSAATYPSSGPLSSHPAHPPPPPHPPLPYPMYHPPPPPPPHRQRPPYFARPPPHMPGLRRPVWGPGPEDRHHDFRPYSPRRPYDDHERHSPKYADSQGRPRKLSGDILPVSTHGDLGERDRASQFSATPNDGTLSAIYPAQDTAVRHMEHRDGVSTANSNLETNARDVPQSSSSYSMQNSQRESRRARTPADSDIRQRVSAHSPLGIDPQQGGVTPRSADGLLKASPVKPTDTPKSQQSKELRRKSRDSSPHDTSGSSRFSSSASHSARPTAPSPKKADSREPGESTLIVPGRRWIPQPHVALSLILIVLVTALLKLAVTASHGVRRVIDLLHLILIVRVQQIPTYHAQFQAHETPMCLVINLGVSEKEVEAEAATAAVVDPAAYLTVDPAADPAADPVVDPVADLAVDSVA
ncbi:hypothetical protein SpCBS45565_g03154 [Spizellomyces sp. 'palustris']|nr:hypothetical protein SpCBS45565_g03154 [Spizellomyces sp. 'palustris']